MVKPSKSLRKEKSSQKALFAFAIFLASIAVSKMFWEDYLVNIYSPFNLISEVSDNRLTF